MKEDIPRYGYPYHPHHYSPWLQLLAHVSTSNITIQRKCCRDHNSGTETTSNVRHCNSTKDCYKIFRDTTIECVLPIHNVKPVTKNNSYGTCQARGCQRNNDNCYHGELCIKNRCVPVSEVRSASGIIICILI